MIQRIGIPYDGASSFLQGPALAPGAIRAAELQGSANCFSESGLEIREGITYSDQGDIFFENQNPAYVFQTIREAIKNFLSSGHKVMSLGGDHSVSYPIIEAHKPFYPDLHILHFDAHADLYDNFDDNPYSHASPFARIMETGGIASLTQIGIRTLEPHQRAQAKRFGVNQIEMKNFSMDFIRELKGPLYISLDFDALDPAFAPGVSHHEPGGLSTREVITMIQRIQVPVIGADLVEYNPTRDMNEMTAMVSYKLMKELIAIMNQ
jgi:agmatinase